MKKTSSIALLLAIASMLTACGNTTVSETGGASETTVNLIDKYTAPEEEPPELPEHFVIPEGYTYEKEYRYFPDGDNSDGIRYRASAGKEICGDRMYYHLPNGLGYIDIRDGKKYTLCPDPICAHTAESGCQFIGLIEPIHHPEKEDILFAVQSYNVEREVHNNICVINEKEGTVTKLYGTDVKGSELGGVISLRYMVGDKLYFTRRFEETPTNESGEAGPKVEIRVFTMDVNTYDVKQLEINNSSLVLSSSLIASNKHILFCDHAAGRVMAYDLNYENGKVLAEFDPSVAFAWDSCYDSVTDELYFNIISGVVLGTKYDGPEIGDLYRVDSDLNCEKLDIADKIINFAVTRNYIYFTRYEPVEYGETEIGTRCVDVNGGKFYRIRRDGTSEAELVFDGGLKLNFIPYFQFFVLGDYLYYNWAYPGISGYAVALIPAYDDVRIGITDKTVRSMSHD